MRGESCGYEAGGKKKMNAVEGYKIVCLSMTYQITISVYPVDWDVPALA